MVLKNVYDTQSHENLRIVCEMDALGKEPSPVRSVAATTSIAGRSSIQASILPNDIGLGDSQTYSGNEVFVRAT